MTKTDELNEAIKRNSEVFLCFKLVLRSHINHVIITVISACGNEARGRTREVSILCDNYYSFSSSSLSCSEEKESRLTREIEDLKSKLMTKTDELTKAAKNTSKV